MKHIITSEKYFEEHIFDLFKKKEAEQVQKMKGWPEIFKEYGLSIDKVYYEKNKNDVFVPIDLFQDIPFVTSWPSHPNDEEDPVDPEDMICLKFYFQGRLIGKITEARDDWQRTIFKVKGYFYKDNMIKTQDVDLINFRKKLYDLVHRDIQYELEGQKEQPVAYALFNTTADRNLGAQLEKAQRVILDWHQNNTKQGRRKFYGLGV